MHLFHLRIAQNDGFVSDASGTLAIVGKGAAVGCKGEVTLENVTYFIEQSIDSKIPKIIEFETMDLYVVRITCQKLIILLYLNIYCDFYIIYYLLIIFIIIEFFSSRYFGSYSPWFF